MKVFNRSLGIINEDRAVNYLKSKKYRIVERNYVNKLGEIDIIAVKDGVIVFVEVKYRTTAMFGYGREAIDDNKIWKIRKVATQYLIESGIYGKNDIRFDVIDILDDKITHIENAF